MNWTILPVLLSALLLVFSSPYAGAAAPKKKGKPGKAEMLVASKSASEKLNPLVRDASRALYLKYADQPDVEHLKRVPGELAVLRGSFVAQRAAAPVEQQPVLVAAVAVCDVYISALDERRETRAKALFSNSPKAKGKGQKPANSTDEFFNDQVEAAWKLRRSELLARITDAYSKLEVAEGRARQ